MTRNELEMISDFSDNCIMICKFPELGFLLQEVEKEYGRRIATSTDFNALEQAIQEKTKEVVSCSTLKRLWGYVTLNPVPRISTLDILARFAGYKDYKDFCKELSKKTSEDSGFITSDFLDVSTLADGTSLQLGWAPNRLVLLKYHGAFRFEVIESINSKLEPGDTFEIANIIVGYPLYIPRILRNGEYTPSYIAGREGGISILEIR